MPLETYFAYIIVIRLSSDRIVTRLLIIDAIFVTHNIIINLTIGNEAGINKIALSYAASFCASSYLYIETAALIAVDFPIKKTRFIILIREATFLLKYFALLDLDFLFND